MNADQGPQGWRPDPGDKVSGRLVDIVTGDGGYGPYPILTLSDEAGSEVSVHAFHSVLRNELARRRPKIGDELEITYVGKGTSKDGKTEYHTYRVVGGQVQGYNWDQDLPEDQRQVASDPVDAPIDSSDLPAPAPQPDPVASAVSGDDGDLPF